MAEGPAALFTEELLRGLECPVCQEYYRDPRILQCGHTLCLKPCLEQIVAGKRKFKCPECRTKHDVPSDGLHHFPKNVVVSRQLDVRPKALRSLVSPNCPICGEEDDLRKCGHCERLMCLDCVMKHLPLYREQLKEKAFKAQQKANAVMTEFSNKTQLEISSRENVEQVVKQIDLAEERAIRLIRSKAASLRNDVQSSHKKIVADIAHTKKTLWDEWADFASRCQEDEKALCDIDDKLPTTKLRKMGERLSKEPKHTARDLDTMSKFEVIDIVIDFECVQEAMDKWLMLHSHTNKSLLSFIKKVGEYAATVSQLADVDMLSKDISKVKHTFKSPPGSVQVSRPEAVAVDNNTGDVVVADTYNNRVLKFDSRGNLVLCFGSSGPGPDQLYCPIDIVVNDKNQMIVCDRNNIRLKIHNRNGSLHSVLRVDEDGNKMSMDPTGIALDDVGNIHVCDWSNSRVHVITQSGAHLSSYGITNGRMPWNIRITEDGKICILSQSHTQFPLTMHLNILSQHHELITSWKVPRGAWGISVTREHVLVCDKDTSKLHVYDFRGHEVKIFIGGSVAGCSKPRGLAVDRQGNVYMACRKAVVTF